ncbi:UNVERIFIED_ORG: site-specific recombinase XerC [Arthrobacter sp. UYCu721]
MYSGFSCPTRISSPGRCLAPTRCQSNRSSGSWAYLASIEKSPNTIKAYAHDLKDWFTYLDRHGGSWQAVSLGDVAEFVAWLRLPPGTQ